MSSEAPQREEKEIYPSSVLFCMNLNIPVINHKATMRRRLDEKLNSGLAGKLTLVTAPAGFGKTTAVVTWLRQINIKSAWFSIECGDNNLKRFWSCFIAALDTIQPGIKSDFSQYLYATNYVIIEDVVTTLVDEIFRMKEDFILVLDDYQFIDDIPVHTSLALLLKYLPANAHIVVISRTRPPFCTVRLQTIGDIKEIGISDLKFNSDEIQEFCQEKGKVISKDDVLALEAYTKGWAAGLCLISDSAGFDVDYAKLFSTANWDSRRITSYLTEEVMNRWNEDEKEFVLRTSILSSMTGSLCDALTGRTDGKQMLQRLSGYSAFIIPMDEEGCWYRYHHIFSEFLQEKIESSNNALLYTLRDHAGEWYEKNGCLPEAVTNFLKNKNFDRASDIIETLSMKMLTSGEFSTLLDWLGNIPKANLKSRAMLCLTYAWALLLTDSVDEAVSWIDAAESRNEEPASNEAEEQWKKQLQGEIAAVKSFMGIKQNNPKTTLQNVLVYQSLGLEKSLFCSNGLNSSKGEASLLAGMFGMKGNLSILDLRFSEIYKRTREIQVNRFGYIPVLIGELLYERNNIDEALPLLIKGMEEAEDSNTSASFVPAVITLAKVMIDRGNLNGAFETITNGVNKLQRMGGFHLLPLLFAFRARLSIVSGDFKAAEEWTGKNCLDIYDAPCFQRMYEQITLVRVLLAKKDYDNCILMLYKLLLFAEKEQHLLYAIELLNLSAILYNVLGQAQKAMEMLQKSLELGEKEGYARIFIEEGIPMASLLERFLKWYFKKEADGGHSISPIYIRELMKQTGNYSITIKTFTKNTNAQGAETRHIQPLTKRERDVMRLLTSELTNAEIAYTLDIAVNTVKVNCTNIYRKLNVKNRNQAVNVAREAKLLA